MSMNYHFVNREKKAQVEQLKKLLETEREGLFQRLGKFGEENPLAMGNIEDIVFALRPAMTSSNVQSWDDDMEIGIATSTKFYWGANNGLSSLDDVEQFQKEHPECVIENEYGDDLSFADFKKSVKDLGRG